MYILNIMFTPSQKMRFLADSKLIGMTVDTAGHTAGSAAASHTSLQQYWRYHLAFHR